MRSMGLGAGHDRLIPRNAVERCGARHGTPPIFQPRAGHLLIWIPVA
ncbi:hypothetical protein [Roseomonas xinghualingensis]|nr:hypothetical protein [Roseomonas sp. SXEYE001]MCV4208346.1 hypothetical protein [Roseomonas sp. SXEYE001]